MAVQLFRLSTILSLGKQQECLKTIVSLDHHKVARIETSSLQLRVVQSAHRQRHFPGRQVPPRVTAIAAVLSAILSTLLELFQPPEQRLALQQHKRILNKLITALAMTNLRVIMMQMQNRVSARVVLEMVTILGTEQETIKVFDLMHSNDRNRDKQGSFQTDMLASVCEQVGYTLNYYCAFFNIIFFLTDQVSFMFVCLHVYRFKVWLGFS